MSRLAACFSIGAHKKLKMPSTANAGAIDDEDSLCDVVQVNPSRMTKETSTNISTVDAMVETTIESDKNSTKTPKRCKMERRGRQRHLVCHRHQLVMILLS